MLQVWKKLFLSSCLIVLVGLRYGVAAEQKGVVLSGDTPIGLSTVKLFSAGRSRDAHPVLLGSARTNGNGVFAINFDAPSETDAVLYLIADGGSPVANHFGIGSFADAIRLASVIGPHSVADGIVINERTTVAAAYALAQFSDGSGFAGPYPGLQNAAATVWNLVNPVTGDVGLALGSFPNGLQTSTMREFNSLANMLAGCTDGSTSLPCLSLFLLATPPRSAPPRNTFQAALNIAHNPGLNVSTLFVQSRIATTYKPTLLQAPDAWTLAITYDGNGHEFDGPGNMAIDKTGAVWVTNDYVYDASPFANVCGGVQVLKLTPTGADAPGAPYSGGGLYGAGFGIAVDPTGNAWLSNFGFQGSDCALPAYPGSVSKFTTDGAPVSPATGYRENISQPQGTAADQNGNIWIANCGTDSVTKYPGGNAAAEKTFSGVGLVRPFGLAMDGAGNAWISSSGNNGVVGLSPNGDPLLSPTFTDKRIQAPLGVAVDSQGNVWTANSGAIELPCGGNQGKPFLGKASVAKLSRVGKTMKASIFTGGGITVPWGIAVDGDDNVWVANFGGQRLSEFCGVKSSKCPAGMETGDPISPDTGYTSDALTRNTGVAIDPSGNIWLANNWMTLPIQTNPGGHGLVVFIGLATPIKTPLNGVPIKP